MSCGVSFEKVKKSMKKSLVVLTSKCVKTPRETLMINCTLSMREIPVSPVILQTKQTTEKEIHIRRFISILTSDFKISLE